VSAASADDPAAAAARVGDTTITVADVDAHCGDKCARLLAAIADERRRTVDLLVDQALLDGVPSPTPAPHPVSEEEVERYRIAHASELTGDEQRDRAAVRFLLERDQRAARDHTLLRDARRRTPPRIDEGALVAAGDARGGATVVATVGSERITLQDIERRGALALYRLRGELARERVRQVTGVVDEQLWSSVARARGTTAEQVRAEAAASAPAVTESDMRRYFVDEVKPRDPSAIENPDRIRPYLEFRARKAAEEAALAEIRRTTKVEILLTEPAPPVFHLASLPGALSGAADAPVQIVLLTSFRGAPSRLLWEALRAYAEAGDAGVALAVRPLLPQWDPDATAIAAAVACAAQQGRWWSMLDTLSRADPLPGARAILKLSRALGLDEGRFAACVSDPATPDAIAQQSAEAERLGLAAPPIVLVNGLALGAPSADRLAAAVSAARAQASAGAAAGVRSPSRKASASP
jgi:protein-disulfide isomerase